MNKSHDTISDIRKIRHQISNEFGHNPKRYIDYLKNIKENYITQTALYEESPNKALHRTSR